MNNLIDKLVEAQKYAISIRPKIGGFPYLAEVLCQAGVKRNLWSLPSCQSIYLMDGGNIVQQGNPLFIDVQEIPKFNQEALIIALRIDQAGKGTFPEFLQSAWRAGVVSYNVDFMNRKVTYYGVLGEIYVEEYSAVEIKK